MQIDMMQMEGLLKQLLQPNDENRAAAENAISELERSPEIFLSTLLAVLHSSTFSSVRNLSCILIRQKLNLSDNGLWMKLSPDFQSTFKYQLIQLLETEKELNIREKICQCIGELGLNLLSIDSWPELIPCIFALSQSPDPATCLSGISIIHNLTSYFVTDKDDFPNLLMIFQMSLKMHEHPIIQVETCRAVCSLIHDLETPDTIQFVNLIPLILRALGDMLNRNRVTFAAEIIKALSELVEVHPTFFKQNLESLIQAMISIARPATMDEDTRRCSLEFLTILVQKSPVMIRALPSTVLVIPLLHILFSILVAIPDEGDWDTAEDEPDEDESIPFYYALSVLNRVALDLRGRVLLPSFYPIVEEYMHSENWRCRHAVMFALAQVAEIVTDPQQQLQICQYVISSFQDVHPRVRYASVRCLGMLANDFKPRLQEQMSVASLNAIFSLLDVQQPVRVRYITAAALANFVDGASASILEPVLGNMMQALISPLKESPVIVQQQIISVIASIADVVGNLLIPYYGLVMPTIKNLYIHPPITQSALSDPADQTIFRACALDCVACIGIAAGRELFKQDAHDVLEVMYHEGLGEIEGEGSDMKVYMMRSWGLMCNALKEDFLPYVDMIMPILLKTANQEVEIPNAEDLEDILEDMSESETLDLEHLGVRTNAMEEKATACRVLTLLVDDLHSSLLPFMPQIMHTLLPLLNSSPFPDIQMAALVIMPEILVALADSIKGMNDVESYRQSFIFVLDLLLEFIGNDEVDDEMLIPSLDTLGKVLTKSVLVNNTTIPILGGQDVARIVETMKATLSQSFVNRAMRIAGIEQEDYDEEEIEEYQRIEENENEAHFLIAEVLGNLLQGYPHFALPLIHDIILSDLMELADPSRTIGDRLVAYHVMNKIVEFGGKDGYPYYSQFIPIFISEIHSLDCHIREEVTDALTAAVSVGKEMLCEVAARCVKELEMTVDDPVSREACYAHSNACGVYLVGKICSELGNYLMLLNDHYFWFLNHLPLADCEVNMKCMELICNLIGRGERAFIGETNQNIVRIMQLLCEAVLQAPNQEIEQQLLIVVKSIQMQSTQELLNALWSVLGAEKAGLIQQKLNAMPMLI